MEYISEKQAKSLNTGIHPGMVNVLQQHGTFDNVRAVASMSTANRGWRDALKHIRNIPENKRAIEQARLTNMLIRYAEANLDGSIVIRGACVVHIGITYDQTGAMYFMHKMLDDFNIFEYNEYNPSYFNQLASDILRLRDQFKQDGADVAWWWDGGNAETQQAGQDLLLEIQRLFRKDAVAAAGGSSTLRKTNDKIVLNDGRDRCVYKSKTGKRFVKLDGKIVACSDLKNANPKPKKI